MTEKKQTAEEWLFARWDEYFFGDGNFSFGTQELEEGLKRARAEEREKCKFEFAQMFVDAAKDAEEKGRREERKRCDEKIEDACVGGEIFGRRETANEIFDVLEKEQWHWDSNGLLVLNKRLYERVKARFFGKEKEAKP